LNAITFGINTPTLFVCSITQLCIDNKYINIITYTGLNSISLSYDIIFACNMSLFVNRKILLILSALLITLHALAQSSAYNVMHYTNENGLPQNSVRGIELDKDGFLWIATEAGLVRFDGQRFRLYDKEHYPVLESNRITGLALDDHGAIIFSTEFGPYYDFNHLRHPQPLNADAHRGRFIVQRYDYFWVRNDSAFFRIDNKHKWAIQVPLLAYELAFNRWGVLNNKLYFRDKQGMLWMINRTGQITKAKITGLLPDPTTPRTRAKITGVYLQEKVLYIHAGNGFYRLDEDNNGLKASLVLKTEVRNIGFYRNYPQLNLQVIGTGTDGLYLYRHKQFVTLKHSNGFGNYYPQVPLGDSGVLTDRGPVYPSSSRFDYPFRSFITFKGLLLDSRGHYWISEGRYGHYNIAELDQQLRVLKHFPYGTANCIRETLDGRIWLCSFAGRSLGYIDQDSIHWLPFQWQEPQTILTFLPIDNETFWLGGSRIFAKLDLKTGQQISYPYFEKFTTETLHLDRNKVLWIGTSGNGFFALKRNRIIKMPLDKNTSLKYVHSFIEDKSGFMWMSTNNGLFRCKKQDLDNFITGRTKDIYYQCFKKESGFNTNEFNGGCTPSAIRLGNGKLSFSSLNGLVQFYPDSIREALPDNGIFVDKLLVDGKERDLAREIILNPSFKRLQVEFASPFFGIADNQQIEYNVKGLDQNWYPVNSDNQVILNGIPYGYYSLQFRKPGGFGNNNIITKVVSFKVLPFFYQTWSFKISVVVIICLIILLLVKMRYNLLLKRNKQLEQEVAQRTIHLHNANHLKEKILMMVGHDLQSPLHFLGYLSETNYDALIAQQHAKAGLISKEIKNTTKKIYAFVDEFNLWAKVQDEQFNLKKTIFSLNSLISELQLFFKEILQLNQNTLECTTEGEYELHTNRELLKAVLRNLIDNANKHTHSGTIHIHCKIDDDATCFIRVSDTGEGMSPDVLKKINDLIKRSAAIDFDSGSRLGYQFIIDFATRLNTHVTITSEEHKGTTVLISGIALHQADHKNKTSYPTP
jgi:signal transduction histidine kinase/ligand-binding sensor domain-containing protein